MESLIAAAKQLTQAVGAALILQQMGELGHQERIRIALIGLEYEIEQQGAEQEIYP